MQKTMTSMALAATLLSGGAALAQGSSDPGSVKAGVYMIEPLHTQVMFSVLHMGFNDYGGVFSNVSGEMKLDPASPAASTLDVDVPVASVSTTSAKLDGELREADWLDAAKFPTMHFHASHITRTGPDTADVEGELTLHGVTRPMALKARFIGAGRNPMGGVYTTGFEASGVLERSQFGVGKFVPLVSDRVDLKINAAFVMK